MIAYQTERCVHDLERYVEAIVQARGRGLPVKLGLEVDYVPGREEETQELLAPYPWDYLLGSIHFIDGLGYLHPAFLGACRRRGVPVTLASDAHSPDVVGRDFDRARGLLRSAGYETITVFERRQARQEPLG